MPIGDKSEELRNLQKKIEDEKNWVRKLEFKLEELAAQGDSNRANLVKRMI